MTPMEVADVLETSGSAFEDILTSVPADLAAWHPAPGEWCINECAGHIIEAEQRGFAGRIRLIIEADDPGLGRWDPAAVSSTRHDCARPQVELAAELAGVRDKSIALVRSLRPEQLARAGSHPAVGRLTIGDLLHEWVHHDGNHLRQALANVQAYVWPHMRNAQRFSSG
jgi:hypothetical protein